MENNYILYVGMDASKGKADAAILKVSDRRSVKPKFLRKKLSFKFAKFMKNVATRSLNLT